jgi:hypothetical protein
MTIRFALGAAKMAAGVKTNAAANIMAAACFKTLITTTSAIQNTIRGVILYLAVPTNVVTPYGTVDVNMLPLGVREVGTPEEEDPKERLPSVPSAPIAVPEVT